MNIRAWLMAGVMMTAVGGASGCVVTVQEGSDSGDRKLERKGWVKLGERLVNGKVDRDTISTTNADTRFRRLFIVVEHSSVEIFDMDIEFANGEHYSPNLKHRFSENERSKQIDLPGADRNVRSISFKYGNLPGGGAATVEVWGLP